MTDEALLGAMEAIIFAGGDPIALDRIAQVLEIDWARAEDLTEKLMEKLNHPQNGIHLVRLHDALQMCSNPAFIDPVREALQLKKNSPLSQAALEVLAVVAYHQPVTKAFVEQVRGVDCSGVMGSLVQKGLIQEQGRMELPGRPLLYGTTDHFLSCLHISSLFELPPLESFGTQDRSEAGEAVRSAQDQEQEDEQSTVQLSF